MAQMESPREQATVTVRIGGELKESYQQKVESMSEDLRSHIESVAGSDDTDRPTPDDERLEQAYLVLCELMNPRTRRIDVELAETQIAQQTQIPSSAVRSRVFKPLENSGWIKPRWGHIEVSDK